MPTSDSSRPEARPWRARLLVATVLASLVFMISLLSSWISHGQSFWAADKQAMTITLIEELDKAVQRYRDQHGKLPKTLDLVVEDARTSFWQGVNDDWGRPVHYERDGEGYRLYSYGRDGQPGGTGYDSDLIHGARRPKPSLHDFLTEQPSGCMISTCLLAAGLTFALSLLLIRVSKVTWATWIGLLCTTIGATVAAATLAGLHIPSYNH